jgi:hypothetical protein
MVKYLGTLLIGIAIGALGCGGYMYRVVHEAQAKVAAVKADAITITRLLQECNGLVQQTKANLVAADDARKQAVNAKDLMEVSLRQALAAKETAEQALAEAKKSTAQ